MRSSDGGVGWTTLGLAGQHLRSLQIDPNDPNVLYAATYGDGVWKTTTASTTGSFAKLTSSPAIVEELALVGSDLYAVGPTGLFRSPDRGMTWSTVGAGQLPAGGTGPASTTATWFTVTGYVSCGATTLYVGGQFKGASSVMVSGDAGATWSPLLGASGVRQTEGGPSGPTWWLATNQLATLGGSNYLATQIALDPVVDGGRLHASADPARGPRRRVRDDRRRGHLVPDDARAGAHGGPRGRERSPRSRPRLRRSRGLGVRVVDGRRCVDGP